MTTIMKISVITVSYNASAVIERTIRSVISQTYGNLEYIVVDGASKDGTAGVIERYGSKIDKWVSEQDSGIYEAMNKGVRMASGEYCIFMNAGDMFAADDVLEKVAPMLDHRYSIIMGNHISLTQDGRFFSYDRHWDHFERNKLFFDSIYHQASFILRSDLIEHPYDESLRMVSDWKLALDLIGSSPERYRGIDVDVCLFFKGGITSTRSELGLAEREMVIKDYFSEKECEENIRAFKDYKKVTNLMRYCNFACRVAYQTLKRIQLAPLISERAGAAE